ncbi:MAG: tRNA 2-thiouridine(34) synthase MnmA [Bacteroidaceae bacterium]|nr:tRNA 2-thiouridine(34) synthase MnmA [Bacteroidaceae bacterium]
MDNKSIAALVSGGVDSAVSVWSLKEQGYTPHLFYIKIGPEEEKDLNCTSEEDIEICTALARRFGCKLDIIDLHNEYWTQVVKYTMDKVRMGLTPNPDVMCNKLIKFGCFEQQVGKDFDLTATGHYATTDIVNGKKWLATSPDPVKDQTDFLAQIDYMQVSKLVFPIGGMMKSEVRAIAERENLINARRKDSQGICFLGQINYNDYIEKYLGQKEGVIVELETGNVLGKHRGTWFHTIGQRHGLGLPGGPWFVIKKNVERNIIYVTRGYDPRKAYSSEVNVQAMHFITECPWPGKEEQPHDVCFKIRHSPEFHTGKIIKNSDGTYKISSDKPIYGVAPGQFCVVYDSNHHLCYGSGEITI